MQRIDVFILGGQVHAGHTNGVHVFVVDACPFVGKCKDVLVEHLGDQEVCSCRALERSAYFNHPVHHFGSVFLGYIMSLNRT